MVIYHEGKRVKGYLTLNFMDKKPVELFITMDAANPIAKGFAHCTSILVSKMLRHGIDPDEIIAVLEHQRFEPAGLCEGKIHSCSSIADYIAKWMKLEIERKQHEQV